MMNSYNAIGNLTRDPESHSFASGTSVVKFGIAINGRPLKQNGEVVKDENDRVVRETVFWDCEAWGDLAKMIATYAKKGNRVAITAEVKEESWEDKNTQTKRSKKLLRLEKLNFLSGPSDDNEEVKEKPAKKPRKKAPTPTDDESVENDGADIPF